MQSMNAPKQISTPTLSQKSLCRGTLVEKLEEVISRTEHHYKLVVLCAPAGYGKTSLLAHFAQKSHLPCCWYFLAESDMDRVTFLTTLILSLRQRFPTFGKNFDDLLSRTYEGDDEHFRKILDYPETVMNTIIKAIASEIPEPFVLLLCNYQLINAGQEVKALVNQLLRMLPPQCVVVIESRAVPEINFVSLMAHDEVVGFDHTFFSFTTQEIHQLALLQGVPPPKKKEAQYLTSLFGGWTAGILLGTRLGGKRILGAQNISLSANQLQVSLNRQNLFAYMINEVFSQNLELFSLLKEAAILQEMNPAFANQVLEREDMAEHLHYLEQQGLFVERQDDNSQVVYICHPVLREVLYDILKHEQTSRFLALHSRAMEMYRANGENEKAIYHAFEADLLKEAIDLIYEISEQNAAYNRGKVLIRWLDLLLPRLDTPPPELLLMRANIHLQLGEYAQTMPLLARISEILAEPDYTRDKDIDALLQSRLWLAQSKVAFQMREYTKARALCTLVIEQTSVDEVELHAEAQMRIGICSLFLENLSLGITHLQKALHLRGRSDEQRQTAEIHDALARTYCLLGNFALADHHLARASKCWERLRDDYGKINNLLCAGVIRHYQEDLVTAEAMMKNALALTRGDIPFPMLEAHALAALGGIFIDQALYDQALACLDDALQLAEKLEDRLLMNDIRCNMTDVYLLMHDADTASLILSEVNQETLARKGEFERTRYEKTYGTILLFQKRYAEAYACFSALENKLRALGYEYGLFKALLRLAECQIAQQEISAALQIMNDLGGLFTRNNYKQLLSRELKYLPLLEDAIKTQPEFAFVNLMQQPEAVVGSSGEKQEVAVEKTIPPLVVTPVVATPVVPEIRLCGFGAATISIDGKPVTRWRMSRSLELFFLLLESERPVRKEQIISALWPDASDNINQTLHSTVYYLRKTLGETCIGSDAGTYWIDLASHYGEHTWYDVSTFQAHYKRAKDALALNQDEPARAELLEMVELFRGDYMQSFYSDWCMFRRESLRQTYLDARQQLAQIAWRREQYDECTIHWQHILAVDSCLEDAHYWVMRCYIRQGKRGMALRQYQRCTKLLRTELKAEPGQTIQNLYQQLTRSVNKSKSESTTFR